MLVLIVSIVVLVAVFLPWWTVSAFGFSASSNGFHNGGILTFLAALAGIALAFLEIPNARYRVFAIGGAGILALLGVIIALADLGGASMGFGMIIALIASAALIVVGFMEGRKINMFKTSETKPPASPPPAPPAK
jgi:peptidoglycan/LPS O-acetylase OafA/YrhL